MRLRKNDNLPCVNLLDLKPVRTLDWQTAESDRVILLVPKFKNSFLVRWILPRLKSSHFKVKLDAYGSCVWVQCDGSATVYDIGLKLKERFGDPVEPVHERVGRFVQQLKRHGFVAFKE